MVRTFLKVYMELQLRYEKNQYHNIVMGHDLGNLVFICYQSSRCRLGKEMTTRCVLKSSESRKARTRGIW